MLVVMQQDATSEDIRRVVKVIEDMGYQARPIPGEQRMAIGVVGNDGPVDSARAEGLPGVQEVISVSSPYKLVSREWKKDDTLIPLFNGTVIGGNRTVVMAGPCGVEDEAQLLETAEAVALAGATILRGGAFKPRTSPYSYQGMGIEGLKLLAKARDRYQLAIITEAIDLESLDAVEEYADIIQIGARNMQNFSLLRRAGRAKKPVMLKRGLSATLKEWLLAAEYILAEGNEQVIMCERGVRSFETYTRNMVDINAIPVIKQLSHLPIIADPSHGTGRRELVAPIARAAVAAGADGIMVEVHRDPTTAKSDGPQSLYPEQFRAMMADLHRISDVMGKPLTASLNARGH